MSFIQKWLDRKIKASVERSKQESQFTITLGGEKYSDVKQMAAASIARDRGLVGSSQHEIQRHPDLSFRMYRAENGYVMEVRQVDLKTERSTVNLHVISEDQDLGTAISHVITLESLKVN